MVYKAESTDQEKSLEFRVNVLGRHVYVTDAMKDYAYEKLSKIDRFHNHTMDIHVTMDVQKMDQLVNILLQFSHFKVKVAASSTDMYASINKAVEKLQQKIRRWKDRIQDHHKKDRSIINMQVDVLKRPFSDIDLINDAIEMENKVKEAEVYQVPHIVGSDIRPLKMLTMEEAVMKMELSDDYFMLFRAEEDQKLKVIYRRKDGDYGLIVPE